MLTLATSWYIVAHQKVNVNVKFAVTAADCRVFSVQKNDTLRLSGVTVNTHISFYAEPNTAYMM